MYLPVKVLYKQRNIVAFYCTHALKMSIKGLLVLLLVAQIKGQLLQAITSNPIEVTIDAEREQNAMDAATERLQARNDRFDAIRAALDSGTVTAVSSNLGAHQQLNFLGPSLQDKVAQAEFYNDYIASYTEGLSDNDKNSILNYNNLEITKAFPGTGSPPSYPDCATLCASSSSEKYRTQDGLCNHLTQCVWGASGTTLRRLLPADYSSHDNSPTVRDSNPFTLARSKFGITRGSNNRITSPRDLSQMCMNWGQFTAHDQIATPARSVPDAANNPININCTDLPDDLIPEDCFNIVRRRLIRNFIRSAPGIVDKDGKYVHGRREQLNAVTAFIDGSQIYGSSDSARNQLYDSTNGKLLTSSVSPVETEQFPPTDGDQYCESENLCFKSGDSRMNVQLGMNMLHTLFLREHNRIAEIIQSSTSLNGLQIFKETRRIIGAMLQSITYNDYLPLILGPDLVSLYGLNPTSGTQYDSSIDPSIINSFGTAAFRFGHSQIYNVLRMARTNGSLAAKASLYSTMFNPDRFYANNGHRTMFRYIIGLAHDKAEAVDTTFSSSMVFRLFRTKTPGKPSHTRKSIPLPAINIHRGRDHGLPNCGSFMDLIHSTTGVEIANINDEETRAKDLYYCGLEETHMTDAEIGPIFGHIIAKQFRDTMLGDRYFYSHTNTDSNIMFTAAQRAEIEKTTLSQLICRHTTENRPNRNPFDLKMVPNALLVPGENNVIVDCEDDILPTSPDITLLLP